MLDDILAKAIGLRLFEPQIKMQETSVVKMSIQRKASNGVLGQVSNRSGASSSLNQQVQDPLDIDHFKTPGINRKKHSM